MTRANNKGRSRHGPPFAQLFHYMMECEAWRTLAPNARSVLVELARRYNGTNNGRIALSVRDASKLCAINKDTAGAVFQILEERGFIECAQAGVVGRQLRIAAEWRLTWHRCDKTNALPSKAFTRWQAAGADQPKRPQPKQIAGPKRGDRPSEKKGQRDPAGRPSVRNEGTVSAVSAR